MRRWLCATAIAVACSCSNLQPADVGVCGNGAIDTYEDCDGPAGSGYACGSAGSSNACHFVCGGAADDGSGSAVCPPNSRCGVDLRCRAPSGVFVAGPGPYPMVPNGIKSADVNGDGYADLVGVDNTLLQVRYGSPTGDLATVTDQTIPSTTNQFMGDLDGDGRSDVVVPTSLGVVTLLGSAAGGFDPHPYTSLPLTSTVGGDVRVHQITATAGKASSLVAIYDVLTKGTLTLHEQLAYEGSDAAICFDGSLALGDSCPPTPTIASLLGGDVVIGKTGYEWTCSTQIPPLTPGICDGSAAVADDTTDEVAVVVMGSASVTLLTAMESSLGSGASGAALAHVQDFDLVQAGSNVRVINSEGQAGFADFDGDGCPDFAVPALSTSGSGAVQSSFALAFDQACSGKLGSAAFVTTGEYANQSSVSQGVPLLYVDLDGDGRADVVTDHQIFRTTCAGQTSPCSTSVPWRGTGVAATPRIWTRAITTDVNHDGHPDIAGFIAGDPDVDVLLDGAAGNTFARYALLTDQPVHAIATGDYDGDGYLDIAVVTGASGSDEDDTLSISFGAPAGGPGPLVPMGSFDVVREMESAAIDATPLDPEGADDLIVVADRGATRSGALLLGSPSRQVIAPFEIQNPNAAPALESPLTLLIGNFDDSPGLDIAEISTTTDAFVMSGIGGGDVALGASFATGTNTVGTNPLAAAIHTKVVDVYAHGTPGSGAVESVVAFGTATLTGGCGGKTAVVVATPETGSGSATWDVAVGSDDVDIGSDCYEAHSAVARDLDGDGGSDIALQACASASCADGGETVIIWTDAGAWDFADATPIDTGGLVCGRFSLIQPATAGTVELVAPCQDATGASLLTTWLVANHEVTALGQIPIPAADLRVISVADFNGDGLEDIMVTSGATTESAAGTEVNVFLQCATNTSCAEGM